jgi:pimeloyl-[acyl-carrier protein] synthase
MSSAFRFQDIFARGVQDPYPFYHWLRTEAPVHWNAEIVPAWFISRYDDVVAVTEGDRRFCSRGGIESAVQQERNGCFWHTQAAGVLFTDGVAHSRARGLLNQSLPLQHMAQMRGRILELANTLLDGVPGAGTMEIVTEFAEPLAYGVFREFVGCTDLDLRTLHRWAVSIHATYDALGGPEEAASGQQVCREMSIYFRDLIGRRRKSPGTDLVSSMLAAERDGAQFTDEEILGCLMQVIPGPDVTMMLISNAVLTLLRHPDQLALLKTDPALIGGAIEECLRYDSMILGFARVATEDVNVRGQLIHKGETVFPLLRSANRDPARFPDPDRLDITRQDLGQLSFGHGVHACPGAPLARPLAQIGINTLVQRLSGPELAAETLEYRKHFNFRALLALPISFQPASKSFSGYQPSCDEDSHDRSIAT